MKSKTEIKLDKEFEKVGIKPRIYHFRDVGHQFIAITIATTMSYEITKTAIEESLEDVYFYTVSPATTLLEILQEEWDVFGVAICDKRDQFNRQRGRIIAKGRLLKHLKGENRK